MSSAAKAISSQGLKRRALSLGAVKAFDHALQFLLPVVLVRCLDTVTFGEYRLIWLALGTLMAVMTLNMAGSLYFFVPRSEPARKRVFIQNSIIYLAFAGVVSALLVSPWNPWLPAPMHALEPEGALVPAFVAVWFAGLLIEHLPTVDERIRWQGYASLSVAVLRAVLVGAGAWATGDLGVVLLLLLAVAGTRLGLLLYYVYRHHGLGRPWFERAAFSEQFRHAAPFGVSNALFQLRSQSDQWVAASLFALTSFAAFSIAAIVGQVVHIFRHSVMEAFMPTMSRMEAAGDVAGMMEMNSRANAMVGTALFPLLAAAFMFAEEVITIVYTADYVEAADVMRLYILGMLAMVVEIGSVVLLLRQGPFAMKVGAATLALSVAVSWSAAQAAGLLGAALGSVLAIYLDRALVLQRVSALTGIPLRRLQNWRALAWTLASAALAAVLAEVIVETYLRDLGDFVRLVAGTAILGAAYLAMNFRRLLR